ncbi:predicted protein [Histoplasma capsulatum H143]|uniref:Uncharacterized protein n=1 Tax=Ajellomyces capsulatus (strain H143) TaxID=544712 RepID=C6HN80_AJECH|nr:predicted protein [Histoplasma capsulatum H143]
MDSGGYKSKVLLANLYSYGVIIGDRRQESEKPTSLKSSTRPPLPSRSLHKELRELGSSNNPGRLSSTIVFLMSNAVLVIGCPTRESKCVSVNTQSQLTAFETCI